jgi:hypothetical protein
MEGSRALSRRSFFLYSPSATIRGSRIRISAASPQASSVTASARSVDELDKLVGRIALYPDDLAAIILPAATKPLQLVQAVRFLEKRKAGRRPESFNIRYFDYRETSWRGHLDRRNDFGQHWLDEAPSPLTQYDNGNSATSEILLVT